MGGIYIHIPFCKQKCSYCDFHFSTDSSYVERMVNALIKEIENRATFLKEATIDTVYFGGGTPSLIESVHLRSIVRSLGDIHDISAESEWTLEANPEDLSPRNLSQLKDIGINRLSIGIQSFDDTALKSMNRVHDADTAKRAVHDAQNAGFDNISVDLIYGLPDRRISDLETDLNEFMALGVQHISAYALTIEPATLYAHRLKKGELDLPDEDEVADQFHFIRNSLGSCGFEQYEVSNFCQQGKESEHNSAYWSGKPYLGIGPSAHSFDGEKRLWNISNNFRYMAAIEKNELPGEEEYVDAQMRYNEYILTRSRTKWGLDLDYVKQVLGVDILLRFERELKKYEGTYAILEGNLILNSEGLLRADGFASDIFLTD